MTKDVTYNLNDVIKKLSVKIANLEIQLAHEQAKKEAYQERVEELEADKELYETEDRVRGDTEDET